MRYVTGMKVTSIKNRPGYPLLATLLVALSACNGGTGGQGGGDTGGGGTTGDGGAGGAGGGGAGGTGGNAPACEVHAPRVFGCVLGQGLPAEPTEPVTLVTSGTVAAVRDPDPAEPCSAANSPWYTIGNAVPEVMIDLVDAGGSTLTLGLAVPGLSSSAIAVGDSLSVDFGSASVQWGGELSHLRVERGGQLLAAVGENEPIGLTLGDGQSECYQEDVQCGRETFEVTVEAPDGSSVSIPNGATADVGALSVTNDRYFHNYDTSGGCNFGLAVEYLVGVAPAP